MRSTLGSDADQSWLPPNPHGEQLPAQPEAQLEVELHHVVGPLMLDLRFTLTHPWTVLFAPSGAGKTTVLRVIAGLDQPQSGRVVFTRGKQITTLTDTTEGIFVPTHRRGVRMVAQHPALFPNRTVLGNVLYGAQHLLRGAQEKALEAQWIEEVLTLCRVVHLQQKMPAQLSGGERQRVSLARALGAGRGRLLLLDEPFTGLDGALREELIVDLRRWLAQRAVPVLMVTHDLSEVFSTDATVLRMEEGTIVASGAAGTVLGPERERLLIQLRG